MDLGGRTAWILPGCGLFAPGRERIGGERSQGNVSPPTTMMAYALCPPRRVNSEAEGHLDLRRRTTNLCGRLASDCRVPHNCSPMPGVARTSQRLCRDVCALAYGRTADMRPNGASAQPAKNAKIVGTNSTSPLESLKLVKNELKTNSNRSKKLRSGDPKSREFEKSRS